MITFAEMNPKGGSGKSAGAVNVGYALMRKIEQAEKEGKKVKGKILMVDSDMQATLTEHLLGVPYPIDDLDTNPPVIHPSFYHALRDVKRIDPIVINERIHLIPANKDLQKAEIELLSKANYQTRTQRVLQFYAEEYDYCVIDTPGTANMLTVLALGASHQVVVPVKSELNAIRALHLALDTIKDVQESGLNPKLKLWGIMVTQHKLSPLHNSEIINVLKHKYGDLLYSEISNETTKYNDAATLKGDVSLLDSELAKYWDRVVDTLLENERKKEVDNGKT
jgi:chromosome partitioning protein